MEEQHTVQNLQAPPHASLTQEELEGLDDQALLELYNRYPVKLTRPKYEDTDITVTPTWFFRIRNIYTYLIPAFIGLCGLAVWLRRRRG